MLKTGQYVHKTDELTLKIDPVLIHQRYSLICCKVQSKIPENCSRNTCLVELVQVLSLHWGD